MKNKLLKGKKRKLLLIIGVLALVGIFLAFWAFYLEPNRLVTNRVELKIQAWPAAFNQFKIAAVSDIHAGSVYVDEARLTQLVERINQTEPDIIVLLGDFISQRKDDSAMMEPEKIAAGLKGLRARRGVYAVLGNHDWWYDGERVRRALEGAGIRVLENEVVPLEKDGQTLWLLGVPDLWTRKPIELRATMQKINAPGPVIAITHNPDVFPMLPPNIILTLAGHTHGGQVNIPFIGRPIVPSQYDERYAIGHVMENGRHLFVTPGVGTTGVAVRFRVPPEISVLTLMPE